MFIHCELIILSLALALDGRVHSARIIGGHEAVPHSRPYMAIVMGKGGKIHCGGFLLNKNFVMTAAHCQDKSYEVLLGVHNIQKINDAQRVSVEQAFPHEGFNKSTYENDIMLLKVRKTALQGITIAIFVIYHFGFSTCYCKCFIYAIFFSLIFYCFLFFIPLSGLKLSSEANFTQNVKPIALAERKGDCLPKSCLITGWGRTSANDRYMSDVLREVNVTLIKDERCESENLYCSTGNKGTGQGDSGGPLVCEDGKAYGVVSHTYQAKDGQLFYSYAKIPDHKSWIYLTIKNA
uniref:trypsin n=1 Tax=Sparus aurata TaxID=8175 RepID=A0A671UG77_SPAAU